MSLIAEALRKSEAERRRGQVPSLVSLEEWTPRPRQRESRRGTSFAAGAVVSVLAIAFAGWWFLPALRERLGGGAPAAAPAPTVAPAATSDGKPAPTAPTTPPPAPMPTVDARPSDRVTRVDVTPSASVAVEPAAPAASPRPAPPAAAMSTAATAAPAAPSSPPVTMATVPSPPMAEPPFRSPAPPPAYERSSTPAATPPEPAGSAPATAPAVIEHAPLIVELSDSQRAALPPLKLNMHVYAKDPGNRFVLVNGNRLAEGESGSDGVRVIEIRPDGVVIDARSVRVFLPRG